jgi:DNA-binding MarR family transcriptional regulator
MIDADYQDFLKDNIKGLMQSCVTLLNERQKNWIENSEFQGIREGDLRIFGQLRGRTLTISELAREMRMSRQGAQQAIQRLQTEVMIELQDTKGSQGKRICITEKGERYRQNVATHLISQETELGECLGQENIEQLRTQLTLLHRALLK